LKIHPYRNVLLAAVLAFLASVAVTVFYVAKSNIIPKILSGEKSSALPEGTIEAVDGYVVGSSKPIFRVSKKAVENCQPIRILFNDEEISNSSDFSNFNVTEDAAWYTVTSKYKLKPSVNQVKVIGSSGATISKAITVNYRYRAGDSFDTSAWELKPKGWPRPTGEGLLLKRPSKGHGIASLIYLRKFNGNFKLAATFTMHGPRINLYARYKFNKAFSIGAGGNDRVEVIDRVKGRSQALSTRLKPGVKYSLTLERNDGKVTVAIGDGPSKLCTVETVDDDQQAGSLGFYLYENSDSVTIDDLTISSSDRG